MRPYGDQWDFIGRKNAAMTFALMNEPHIIRFLRQKQILSEKSNLNRLNQYTIATTKTNRL